MITYKLYEVSTKRGEINSRATVHTHTEDVGSDQHWNRGGSSNLVGYSSYDALSKELKVPTPKKPSEAFKAWRDAGAVSLRWVEGVYVWAVIDATDIYLAEYEEKAYTALDELKEICRVLEISHNDVLRLRHFRMDTSPARKGRRLLHEWIEGELPDIPT